MPNEKIAELSAAIEVLENSRPVLHHPAFNLLQPNKVSDGLEDDMKSVIATHIQVLKEQRNELRAMEE